MTELNTSQTHLVTGGLLPAGIILGAKIIANVGGIAGIYTFLTE